MRKKLPLLWVNKHFLSAADETRAQCWKLHPCLKCSNECFNSQVEYTSDPLGGLTALALLLLVAMFPLPFSASLEQHVLVNVQLLSTILYLQRTQKNMNTGISAWRSAHDPHQSHNKDHSTTPIRNKHNSKTHAKTRAHGMELTLRIIGFGFDQTYYDDVKLCKTPQRTA